MAMTEVAQATVTIIPNMKGSQAKIAKDLGGSAGNAGKQAGKSFGSKLMGTLGKIAAGAAIGKFIGDSINQGAALQQSLGGIETMFKENADIVKGYASEAYKTAGLSANDYMENVTNFSAALIKSMDNDTAAAAELANTAMIDMADNANKMGTDMSSIQTAYQGFAKQNYTMLDNLKLGYGGTKAEMERLLADASELSGVEYNIDNLDDVYEAIHVIQQDLGITGTTAKEAASTFSGSFASMKAAAENLMGNLALGEDIGPQFEQLGESIKTFVIGNVLPMASNVIQQIPGIVAQIPGFIADCLPDALPALAGMVEGLAQGIIDNIPVFVNGVGELLSAAWDALVNYDWAGAGDIAVGLLETAWEAMKDVAQGVWDAVVGVFTGEIELPDIGTAASEVWGALTGIAEEIWNAVVGFFTSTITWPNICSAAELVWSGLSTAASAIWGAVVGFFTSDIEWPDLSAAASAAWSAITTAASAVWDAIVGFFTSDIEWPDLSAAASAAWSTLTSVASGIWDGIVGFFTSTVDFPSLDELASAAWSTLTGIAGGVWDLVKGVFGAVDISFADLGEIASTAWGTITSAAGGIWDGIKGIFGGIDISFADLSEIATTAWSALGTVAGGIWSGLKTVFGAADVTFADLSGVASTAWSTLSTAAGSVWDGIKGIFGSFEIEWPDFGELAAGALEGLKNAAQGVWDWIKGLFGGGETEEEAVKTISGTTDEMVKQLADVNLQVASVDISTILLANTQIGEAVLSWKRMISNADLKIPHLKTTELVIAKRTIESAVSTYKSLMNFSWSLPTLHGHLPNISVSMNTATSSDGKTTVSYPSLSVSSYKWFAEGGIFNKPTVIGIGDSKGPEAAVPLDMMWDRLGKEVDSHMRGGANINIVQNIDGAENPEVFADRFVRQLRLSARAAY